MARYVYLLTSGGIEAWVKDGKFECLADGDIPQKYEDAANGLVKARHIRLNKLIEQPQLEFITMKFDAKPPYKYHGLVA